MARDITHSPRVTERIDWLEKNEPVMEHLQSLASRQSLGDSWVHLDTTWLAGANPDGTLIAVPIREILPEFDASGVDLGAPLSGLRVRTPVPTAPPGQQSHALLFLSLAIAAGVTLLGGYLLWRDLQREAAAASLRAQFVASVSHELKTPLTAIRMFAETLRMRASDESQMKQDYLGIIVHESERLTRLVNNILEFSKLERGTKFYQLAPVSLREVAESAARTMEYPFSQAGFRLSIREQGSLPKIRADRDALEQVVLNLLTNAMKYSGEAREIELRLTREQGYAVIEVEDHGLGIPIEHQRNIFDSFFRVPSGENHSIPGAGLGLTLADQIIQAHSGTITVRSEPGHGSTFSVRLPMEAIK
jgi:signal transduction histidine kinase